MDLINKIEAILFLYGEELEIERLEKFFEVSREDMINALGKLKSEKENKGINLKIKDGKASFVTNPLYGEDLFNFFNPKSKPKKLSKAALETLTIIAYRQPISKPDIERIRGVNVDGVITSLEEKELIECVGVVDGLGRAKQYKVTENFLKYLNIRSLEDLPNYKEVGNGGETENK
ncbi:MAG: SMC-Scp complex subunit ScpB [Fusobacteriaceae bacterium]|nr:SMC-Scp complex subunit ScpB [Fusobacteriaceae bacterium]MBN2837975.1 SMC-Scp complex subunit ScpB [Fusobacteriaceae bacterium]